MTEKDFNSIRDWFTSYSRSFHTGTAEHDRNIALKEEHTARVCAIMELLAQSLHLTDNDRLLAATIALLHDVGRFEQYRRYGTFKDSASVNHAALGARIAGESDALAALSEEERELVVRSVALHNVFRVPPIADERLFLFVRLIRDADKLDIWRVFIDYYGQPEEERASAVSLGFADLPVCTPEVLEAVRHGRIANLASVRNLNDFKLLQLSWVYDLNFAPSFKLLQERGYLSRLAETLPATAEVRAAVEAARRFLDRSVEERVCA
ncbi:MAG TPA: HD domain-containing protein [Geobacteraceae bacterium]